MKKYILHILKHVSVFIILIIFFIILLVLSSSFPSDWIKNNVRSSAELLVYEGNLKEMYVLEKLTTMLFDNYSDALMINTAYSIDNETPLYSSFVARKNYIPETTEIVYNDTTGELHSASKYKGHDEVHELMDTVNNDITESFEYARYWHGYLVLLRPILLLFDLNAIRIIITMFLIYLSIIVLFNIYKKLGTTYMIIFLLGLIGIEYFYMGVSIQGCSIFLITIIFMKIILEKYKTIKDISIYFFVVGMITNFLDLLTNPLITLGVPLILYFLLIQQDKQLSIKESILIFVKTCIPWVIGYALTWGTKWVLTDIIFHKGLIETALSQILFRTQGTGAINAKLAILMNFTYVIIPFDIILFANIVFLILNKNKKIEFIGLKDIILDIFPYLVILIMPYVWYIVLKNHSYRHAFFTYRNQIMMLVTLPIIYFKCFYFKEKDKV